MDAQRHGADDFRERLGEQCWPLQFRIVERIKQRQWQQVEQLKPFELVQFDRIQQHRLTRNDAFRMIKRLATAAGLPPTTCCHTFRATGITAYLENGGTIKNAQAISATNPRLRPSSTTAPETMSLSMKSGGLSSDSVWFRVPLFLNLVGSGTLMAADDLFLL